MNKHTIPILVILLFIISTVSPMVIGFKSDAVNYDVVIAEIAEPESIVASGPMDSPWPMESHDVRHTGRSPYITANNSGEEIWRFWTEGWAESSPVIGDDGTIYFGSDDFYAVNPNGTMKWKHKTGGVIESCPAIDENGVIYIGTVISSTNYLWAFYTSNGTLKWKYRAGDNVYSSPAVGEDGTIYFGKGGGPPAGYINALYPNGTLRWRYKTNHAVFSSSAIGNDGTVYCGSHDGNLYALYPNNGTLKWKYHTGGWIRGNPAIADDGTIYFPSFDDHLYALYPNGTLKWKFHTGFGASGGPAIGTDGTIYVGTNKLYAIYPNGTLKWSFNLGSDRWVYDSSPAISADGTIYIGACIGDGKGGELIAVNPDGTEKWRSGNICDQYVSSSPAIAEDGTVYICSASDEEIRSGLVKSVGYLHAFHTFDPNAPGAPTIEGKTKGKTERVYEYTFTATDPNGDDVYYYIEWGDHIVNDWFGPFASSEEIKVTHSWRMEGTYTIKARCKDTNNLWGPWSELEVTMPKNQQSSNMWYLRWLERFPLLQRLLSLPVFNRLLIHLGQ